MKGWDCTKKLKVEKKLWVFSPRMRKLKQKTQVFGKLCCNLLQRSTEMTKNKGETIGLEKDLANPLGHTVHIHISYSSYLDLLFKVPRDYVTNVNKSFFQLSNFSPMWTHLWNILSINALGQITWWSATLQLEMNTQNQSLQYPIIPNLSIEC